MTPRTIITLARIITIAILVATAFMMWNDEPATGPEPFTLMRAIAVAVIIATVGLINRWLRHPRY